jgi:hypothetical protein
VLQVVSILVKVLAELGTKPVQCQRVHQKWTSKSPQILIVTDFQTYFLPALRKGNSKSRESATSRDVTPGFWSPVLQLNGDSISHLGGKHRKCETRDSMWLSQSQKGRILCQVDSRNSVFYFYFFIMLSAGLPSGLRIG